MTWPMYCWVASLYCRQNSMMLTPCCPRAVPTGGAGVACPARIWSLTTARTFLRRRVAGVPFDIRINLPAVQSAGSPASRCGWALDLRHLVEGELDRRLPVEDVDEDLELGLLHVDLGDGPGEVRKGPGNDAHDVAFLPLQAERRLHLGLLLHREDLLDLTLRQRCRLRPGPAGHEPRDPGRVPHDVPGIVVVDHLDQQIPREDLSLDDLLLPALDLHHVFHGDHHVEDLLLHLHRADPRVQVRLDLV